MRRLRGFGRTCAGNGRSKERPLHLPGWRVQPHAGNFTEGGRRRLLCLRGMHRITQHSDSSDADLHGIAGDERAYAGGRAGGDYVAGIERHHAGNPADQKSAGVNHERSVTGLADCTVDARFDENACGVEIGLDVRANGAKGVEAFAARELNIAFLYVARGDVVEAGVAKNVRQRVIGIAELRATAADYDGKLAFVLYTLRVWRENDGFVEANDGRRRLEEHERLFGDFVAQFGGVSGIVAADADDFRGINR